jgi:hypothetical protein
MFVSITSRPALGPTKPSVQLVLGVLSIGQSGRGREADHFSPSSAEVRNGGGIPAFPHTPGS